MGWRAFDRCRSMLRAYEGRVRWPLTALIRRYFDDQRTLRIARGHVKSPCPPISDPLFRHSRASRNPGISGSCPLFMPRAGSGSPLSRGRRCWMNAEFSHGLAPSWVIAQRGPHHLIRKERATLVIPWWTARSCQERPLGWATPALEALVCPTRPYEVS